MTVTVWPSRTSCSARGLLIFPKEPVMTSFIVWLF
jgi:hypothetical protein